MGSPVRALELRGISRRFGLVQALDAVDLTLRTGEVHALLGENGAGKTTLARIVAGSLRKDKGEMMLFGRPYAPSSRREGAAAGVAYVPQHLSLVRGLTVVENLQLGRPGAPLCFRAREARQELERLAEEYELRIRVDALVEDLPLAERQKAEILTAVAWGARVLLLDEPTSALGPHEVDALLSLCAKLRARGTTIVYISHKLREIAEVADRVTVLRQGRVVAHGISVQGFDARAVAALMVGDLPLRGVDRPRPSLGPVRLDARELRFSVPHGPGLRGVSLQVRGGEIVGVVGVAGNGQEELAAVLTGLLRPDAGRVEVDGRDVTGSASSALQAGVAYLPEERGEGLALDLSVADNVTAKRAGEPGLAWSGLRRMRPVHELASRLVDRFEVRPHDPSVAARALSGGNQQKLLAARELDRDPAVLVAVGPTKGLDPLASQVMRDRIFGVAMRGGAVVVITADMDEVLDLAHRVVVLSGGVVTDEFPIEVATSERLGAAMAGIAWPGSGTR